MISSRMHFRIKKSLTLVKKLYSQIKLSIKMRCRCKNVVEGNLVKMLTKKL